MEGEPAGSERAKLATARLQRVAYFRAQTWKPGCSTSAVSTGPSGMVLFAGINSRGAAVELSISGIALQHDKAAGRSATGPAQLRMSDSGGVIHRDLAKIKS
ncbi:MAG: hypothetical protein JWM91_4926 [Rhodospirillales bacterium]|nr:hypothetical protein [Rhodospirillales bacterium]